MNNKKTLKYLNVLMLLFFTFSIQTALAKTKRIALVIGNSSYKDSPLKNPANDAKDMSIALARHGFKVTKLINANIRKMKRAVSDFGKKLSQDDTVGLFYFAGHGIQLNGSNYLIPVNAEINSEADVEFESLDAARILSQMSLADNGLNMVIIDACRNNPYARSFRSASRGLAKMDAPAGSLILYATSPGDIASDGTGRNGLFTEKLISIMSRQGLKIEDVFKNTAIAVSKASGKKQIPYIEGVILGDFYFNNDTSNRVAKAKVAVPVSGISLADKYERDFWSEVKYSPSKEIYEAYLAEYPNGHYARIARIRIKHYEKSHVAAEKKKSTYSAPKVKTNSSSTVSQTKRKTSLSIAQLKKKAAQSSFPASSLKKYGIDMVDISGGNFYMGSLSSEKGRDSDEKKHKVYIDDFKINRTEVTLEAFSQFVKATGYQTDAEKNKGREGCFSRKEKGDVVSWLWLKGRNYENLDFQQDLDHPVVCVSFNDVMAYIKWLNKTTGVKFRLPTEAEWEYAARGEQRDARFWGSNSSQACDYANVADTSRGGSDGSWLWHKNKRHDCNDGHYYTAPVGSYEANAYGLKDMLGNAWEWTCSEGVKLYDESEQACSYSAKVFSVRGGSWLSQPSWVRSANRFRYSRTDRNDDIGFRLVQVH